MSSVKDGKKMLNLDGIRHTLAHLLASSVRDLYPGAENAIGPPIENGFYQDFELPQPIVDADLQKIEKKMREKLKQWKTSEKREVSIAEALKEFKWNKYKTELIHEFAKSGKTITFYILGDFLDLCKGGHAQNPAKEIDPYAFKLTSIAGAYWHGDEKNKMLTRIYGIAFSSKKELDTYTHMLEEAKKRDHKILGKQLGLFTHSLLVGGGLPLFLPKGARLKKTLEEYIVSEKEKRGYSFVCIPHIAKDDLYVKSGHLGKYDAMMPVMVTDGGDRLVMKAMNCPHHFEMYRSEPHSYRDLPLRYAENTVVYRNEKSGEVNGLLRVRALTQDDTHHFVRHDQIAAEIQMILGLMKTVYEKFGFIKYRARVSTRDAKNPDKYFGDDKLWKLAEKTLVEQVEKWGAPYFVEEGEAAFYGPKIDIMLEDAIGREWQLTTVQLDFTQPENFDLTYTGEDGKPQRPAVLHVAIYGSFERFMAILIEHFAGAFPVWLAPVQAAVIPIAPAAHDDYAQEVVAVLKAAGMRVELRNENESLGKRIRAAELYKIPAMLVLGDKEKADRTVAIRWYGDRTQKVVGLDALVETLKAR